MAAGGGLRLWRGHNPTQLGQGWAVAPDSALSLALPVQLPCCPPLPPVPLSPPQVLVAGPPSAPSRSPGQGDLVHVTPACASHSIWPPRLTGSLCTASQQGWGVGSSERPRPPQAEGQTCWGSENGSTGGRCLAVLPGSLPSHSRSSVGDSPGSPDIQPGLFLHRSLHRGIMMAHGDSTGDPSVHSSSQMTEKGVRARLVPVSSACPGPAWLLVSPDGVPHGHGPAQRGQHLVPVGGAHATG